MKCDGCGKVKNDVMLCADDMLCRGCEVANERELGRIRAQKSSEDVKSGATPKSTPTSNAAAKKLASQAVASAGCQKAALTRNNLLHKKLTQPLK